MGKQKKKSDEYLSAPTLPAIGADRPVYLKYASVAAMLMLPVLFFGYIFWINLSYSLNDPDLWWHLRTGQYILDNWSVPDVDPFAFTTPRPLTTTQVIGLRSQWLGQVIFYISHHLSGLIGIAVLRGILIILPMLTIYLWLLEKKFKPLTALIVVSLPALMLGIQLFYAFERPQGFSFYFCLITAMMLERLKDHTHNPQDDGKRLGMDLSYWILPAVMAVWSNIHAGYMLGNVLIMTYMFAETVNFLFRKYLKKEARLPKVGAFLAVSVASMVASFLNPNKYILFFDYLFGMIRKFFLDVAASMGSGDAGWVANVVLEFRPLHYFYTNLGYTWLVFFWSFTALLYVLMIYKYWRRRHFDIADFVSVTILVFFANYYARFLMFALAVLPFYFAKSLYELRDVKTRDALAAAKVAVALLLTLTVGFMTLSLKQSPRLRIPTVTKTWVSPWFPLTAVDFVMRNNLQGPMYNFYTWGGYLIWTMYPKYQVFIDGRALDNNVNRTADGMLKCHVGWEDQVEVYGINFMMIPVVFRESGHIIPLTTALIQKDDWKLVHLRNNAAVFVRNVPRNYDVIYKYSLDKKEIYNEIVSLQNLFLIGSPGNPINELAKAEGLFGLGRYAEAKAIYERYPFDGGERLKQIKALGY